jgi:2-haloacid dehalogenase
VKPSLAFDMYGTLVDPAGWVDVLSPHVSDPEATAGAWRRHQLEISWLLSLTEHYEDWSAVTGFALDAALAERGVQIAAPARDELLRGALRTPRVFDDVRPALAALSDDGFPMAVLSNGTRAQLQSIVADTGLGGYFTVLISVDEIRTFKPSPRVYRHAAQQLGRSLDETWLVSGNPFDAAGAKLAGMRVVSLERQRSFRYRFAPEPDLVVSGLGALAPALRAWRGRG